MIYSYFAKLMAVLNASPLVDRYKVKKRDCWVICRTDKP
ncbi:hypothetical protein C5S31_03465 [ANME-1 cluster archaeon GoMg2]|nr:hypothetical protein [ANME-1 cluster archaeon GoMg2]